MDDIKDIFKGLFEHFGWFIWALVGLGIIWFFTGGAYNESAHEGAYIKPLAPLDSGQTYGTYYAGAPTKQKETLDIPESPADIARRAEAVITDFVTRAKRAETIHANSALAKSISFDGIAGAKGDNPQTEYVRIISSEGAADPIKLSGLTLVGTGLPEGISIPKGVFAYMTNQKNANEDVYLAPGGRAIVSSGVSPLGASFQINKCSGYLNEIGAFTPALRNECPDGSNCRSNAYRGYTYNACVAAYQKDADFYSHEWRIFLGSPYELWKNSREVIELLDAKGNIIDAITY
ncbi:MAG TPA: hypothetical protein VHE10_01670 [Candidatus Paceibacterota bacterium]|nr:hypothetical protein [Candidatus Paceibacterota bacterium]